jgi:hypothetical protein
VKQQQVQYREAGSYYRTLTPSYSMTCVCEQQIEWGQQLKGHSVQFCICELWHCSSDCFLPKSFANSSWICAAPLQEQQQQCYALHGLAGQNSGWDDIVATSIKSFPGMVDGLHSIYRRELQL